MTENSQDSNKIRISNDDLNTVAVNKRVEEMQAAQKVVMVRQVGVPNGTTNLTFRAIATFAGAGLLGGFFAFLIVRLTSGVYASQSVLFINLLFTFNLAFFISVGILLIEAITAKSWNKVGQAALIGIPCSIGFSLAIGFIAHTVYNAMFNYSNNHIPRGVAWLFVGVSAGLTIGVVSKSGKRLLMTVLGGALGGFIGGFIFDFFPGDISAQLVGISSLGLLIGISMSLIEQAAKSQWIEIVTGGMAGKQFILYRNDIVIGSAPNADIQLVKDSAIPAQAARISTRNNQTVIESLHPGIPCNVEGQVGSRFPLFDGANIQFGSTQIRYRSKSKADEVNLGGPVVRS